MAANETKTDYKIYEFWSFIEKNGEVKIKINSKSSLKN